MLLSLYRRYFLAPVESLLWEMLDKSYARVIVSLAYSRVVAKRSGLLGTESLAVVRNGGYYTKDFTYLRTLEALQWLAAADHVKLYEDHGLVDKYPAASYVKLVAQSLLLNQANTSS